MLNHHIKEKDEVDYCLYCHNKLEGWRSEHIHNFHYKVSICNSCGREHWVKVDFEGSGHDNWKSGNWITTHELEKLNIDFQNAIEKFKLSSKRV